MKLLNDAIISELPKLYETEDIPNSEKEIICKFFNPCGSGTWYICEGEERDGDYLLFGLCYIFCWEWGYVSLNELEEVKLNNGLRIERDLQFEREKVSNIAELPVRFKN
jgi:hypothetical protein